MREKMRSQHEPQVFSAVIQDYSMAGEYLIANSAAIFSPTAKGEVILWDNLKFLQISPCSSFFENAYNVKKETYDDWLVSNHQPSLLTPLLINDQLTFISEQQCQQLCNNYDYRWSVFYWLTRPGFSADFSQALIQIYAHCPAGPPQYGSIVYLERTEDVWQVKSSFGLYNQ
ncbi:hypothetical protein H6G27_30440 [Nostoc linckia FACHB-104]|nr:hypothetical protein [Nostoc linckia FACHB-104]